MGHGDGGGMRGQHGHRLRLLLHSLHQRLQLRAVWMFRVVPHKFTLDSDIGHLTNSIQNNLIFLSTILCYDHVNQK